MNLSNPGLSAFAALKAEKESWLSRVFVPPRDYDFIAAPGSTLIYSSGGGGKSALLRALATQWQSGEEGILAVVWHPDLPMDEEISARHAWRDMLFARIGFSLLAYTLAEDARAAALPQWASEFLSTFLQVYPTPLFDWNIIRLRNTVGEAGKAWLDRYFSTSADASLASGLSQLPAHRLLQYLLQFLPNVNIGEIVVLVDGLERWETQDQAHLFAFLSDFLATLALFELPELSFKVALPSSWRDSLRSAGAVARRRVEQTELDWSQEELLAMVDKRLAWAMADPELTLKSLCPQADLASWLTSYGGHSPRGWLALARGIFKAYLENDHRPLSQAQWQEVSRHLLPNLQVFEEDRIFIGEREITGLSPSLRAVVRYLYEHDHRICSREELYFRAYRGLPRVPRNGEIDYESPESWRGSFDMVISRLRQEIEPDPNRPRYLITHRGRGIRLEHTA